MPFWIINFAINITLLGGVNLISTYARVALCRLGIHKKGINSRYFLYVCAALKTFPNGLSSSITNTEGSKTAGKISAQ